MLLLSADQAPTTTERALIRSDLTKTLLLTAKYGNERVKNVKRVLAGVW